MTNPKKARHELSEFLRDAEELTKSKPDYAGNAIRNFWEGIIPRLGAMFACEDTTCKEKRHRLDNTAKNLKNHIPRLVSDQLVAMQNLGNYSAHLAQLREEEYPLHPSVVMHYVDEGRRILDLYFPTHGIVSGPMSSPPTTTIIVDPMGEYGGGPPPSDPPSLQDPFIEKIEDAFDCDYCGARVGQPCRTKDGENAGTNREHTVRKTRYEQYRKEVRDSYDTTIILAMIELTREQLPRPDDVIARQAIIMWFKEKYPAYKEHSIKAHITMMCTNSLARIHHTQHEKPLCQLFFRPDERYPLYRLYNSDDPEPIYVSNLHIHQEMTWKCPICAIPNSGSVLACFVCGYDRTKQ